MLITGRERDFNNEIIIKYTYFEMILTLMI